MCITKRAMQLVTFSFLKFGAKPLVMNNITMETIEKDPVA